jgi:hypothetical protein
MTEVLSTGFEDLRMKGEVRRGLPWTACHGRRAGMRNGIQCLFRIASGTALLFPAWGRPGFLMPGASVWVPGAMRFDLRPQDSGRRPAGKGRGVCRNSK